MRVRRGSRKGRPATLGVAAVVAMGAAMVTFSVPSGAAVSAVTGSAYGYFLNVSLFGGPVSVRGPAPIVGLAPVCDPQSGAPTTRFCPPPPPGPQTATLPSATAIVGPATFFTSGQLNVSTQGTTGATGSVSTTANIANITTAAGGSFGATNVASSCTSSTTGAVSGTTTITGGVLQTDSGNDLNGDGDFTDPGEHAPVTVAVPADPAANSAPISGHIHVNRAQDNFTYRFNEQVTNPDGSLTVYAAHERLLGPTAVGDLYIGKVTCGLTGAPNPTTTTIPSTSTTTTTTRQTTTTTTRQTTTTTTRQTTTTTTRQTTTTTNPPYPQTCDGRRATIIGTPGDDNIVGTPGDDVIVGLAGNDNIHGLGGNDVICGGAGDDHIVGGRGDDILIGGAGNDRLIGGPGDDKLDGEQGQDKCTLGSGQDTARRCENVNDGHGGGFLGRFRKAIENRL